MSTFKKVLLFFVSFIIGSKLATLITSSATAQLVMGLAAGFIAMYITASIVQAKKESGKDEK